MSQNSNTQRESEPGTWPHKKRLDLTDDDVRKPQRQRQPQLRYSPSDSASSPPIDDSLEISSWTNRTVHPVLPSKPTHFVKNLSTSDLSRPQPISVREKFKTNVTTSQDLKRPLEGKKAREWVQCDIVRTSCPDMFSNHSAQKNTAKGVLLPNERHSKSEVSMHTHRDRHTLAPSQGHQQLHLGSATTAINEHQHMKTKAQHQRENQQETAREKKPAQRREQGSAAGRSSSSLCELDEGGNVPTPAKQGGSRAAPPQKRQCEAPTAPPAKRGRGSLRGQASRARAAPVPPQSDPETSPERGNSQPRRQEELANKSARAPHAANKTKAKAAARHEQSDSDPPVKKEPSLSRRLNEMTERISKGFFMPLNPRERKAVKYYWSGSDNEDPDDVSRLWRDTCITINQREGRTYATDPLFDYSGVDSAALPAPSVRASGHAASSLEAWIEEENAFFGAHGKTKKNTVANKVAAGAHLAHLLDYREMKALRRDIVEDHPEEKKALRSQLRVRFAEWMCIVRAGFNLLVHGVGSKKCLLEQFARVHLDKLPVMVVNGFMPAVTIQKVLSQISKDFLGKIRYFSSLDDHLDHILSTSRHLAPFRHFYFIVHNIEGVAFRTSAAQHAWSVLASIPNFHLIASVDHCNAPLLWDRAMLQRLKWVWEDGTTLAPYTNELPFQESLMGSSGKRARCRTNRGVLSVLKSLPVTSQRMFCLLAEFQGGDHPKGVSFHHLLQACQERLLFSNASTLKSQLDNFLDHHIIKSKLQKTGEEFLVIDLLPPVIERIVEVIQQSGTKGEDEAA